LLKRVLTLGVKKGGKKEGGGRDLTPDRVSRSRCQAPGLGRKKQGGGGEKGREFEFNIEQRWAAAKEKGRTGGEGAVWVR